MQPVVILDRIPVPVPNEVVRRTQRSRKRKGRRALFDIRKFYYQKAGTPKPVPFRGWGGMADAKPDIPHLDLTADELQQGVRYFNGFDHNGLSPIPDQHEDECLPLEILPAGWQSPYHEGEQAVTKETKFISICPDNNYVFSFTVQPILKRAIRVLSLCDGISTGLYVLKELGIMVDTYFSSEINEDCLKIQRSRYSGQMIVLGSMEQLCDEHFLDSLGRIDLLLASPPCSDLSMVNAKRLEFDDPTSTAFLSLKVARIRDYLQNRMCQERVPMMWLTEQTSHMSVPCRKRLTMAMGCEPQVYCSSSLMPMFRRRYWFGNVPNMKELEVSLKNTVTEKTLQQYLEPERQATVKYASTLTTSPGNQGLPVLERGKPSRLLITEAERLLGFRTNFTACHDLSQQRRLNVLGRSWSVPIVAEILQPLKEMYLCYK